MASHPEKSDRAISLTQELESRNIQELQELANQIIRVELKSHAARQRAERRTRVVLDFVELLLPKRLRDEDLSDAREVIHRLRIAGAPSWTLYLKTLTTGCWCALNAIGYVLSAFTGRSSRKS